MRNTARLGGCNSYVASPYDAIVWRLKRNPATHGIEGGCAAGRLIAEKGTSLQCAKNTCKLCFSLYRICPYGFDPSLKACLYSDPHSIGCVGSFQLFEQKHTMHLHRFFAE